jgi:carbonic anhydrase
MYLVPNRTRTHSIRSRREPWPKNSDEALERLREGNLRFASGKTREHRITASELRRFHNQQRAFAIILGCSDARVPPELIFDQSLGALFVIRLAGNIITPSIFGTIQYAHLHLGTKVLVVLGHEGCGAVKATLATMHHHAKHPERTQQIVDLIEPGLKGIPSNLSAAKQLHMAVEANVCWSKHQILATAEAQRALQEDKTIRIVGAVYELATGTVRWLD